MSYFGPLLGGSGVLRDSGRLQKGWIWGSLKGALGLIQGRFRAVLQTRPYMEVDSKKLEYGPGAIYGGFRISRGFGVGG